MKEKILKRFLEKPEILDTLIDRMESDDVVAWDNCYFFGSFDPIHNMHVEMALKVLQQGYDVILVPAFKPPHKNPSSFEHRLEMCKLVAKENKLTVTDIESKLAVPTYTIDTLRALIPDFDTRTAKTSFIAGSDTVDAIKTWKEGEQLLKKLDIIAFDRTHFSSTEVRNRLKEGKPISDLVPKCVDDYIYENKLYCSL